MGGPKSPWPPFVFCASFSFEQHTLLETSGSQRRSSLRGFVGWRGTALRGGDHWASPQPYTGAPGAETKVCPPERWSWRAEGQGGTSGHDPLPPQGLPASPPAPAPQLSHGPQRGVEGGALCPEPGPTASSKEHLSRASCTPPPMRCHAPRCQPPPGPSHSHVGPHNGRLSPSWLLHLDSFLPSLHLRAVLLRSSSHVPWASDPRHPPLRGHPSPGGHPSGGGTTRR